MDETYTWFLGGMVVGLFIALLAEGVVTLLNGAPGHDEPTEFL